VTEIGAGVRVEVVFDLVPVVLIVADFLAEHADRQQFFQLPHVGERRLQLGDFAGERLFEGDDALADFEPGAQLFVVEGLQDVIVSARLKAFGDVLLRVTRREHDDVSVRRAMPGPDAAADFDAVKSRHHPVQHGQFRRAVLL
jgi:hypothetical protein